MGILLITKIISIFLQKQKTYERYIPSGIIKTGWLAKHLFEIPSVAVVFEEAVNWETLAVNSEARNRCIERVNAVRNSLTGRQTRIVLVLLLQATSSPLTGNWKTDTE